MESPVDKSDIHLQKMREVKRLKSVEDRRVGSEVFDRITLQTLYKLANQGHIHLLNGAISTGKEANVFKGADEAVSYTHLASGTGNIHSKSCHRQ